MILSKNRPFFLYVFLSKKSQKEIFFDILDSKVCFLDLKREILKNSKKLTFCKGVSPWFLSKIRPFSHMYFWSKKGQKETFFDILNSKECFLDLKREILKTSKKSTFSKGVRPWFLSKKTTFLLYIFF